MKFKSAIPVMAILCAVQVPATAGTLLKDNPVPAEFPPASFVGKQYIDSKGCAFIRAGSQDEVVWVPRVTRSRELVCDMQPTFPTSGGDQ